MAQHTGKTMDGYVRVSRVGDRDRDRMYSPTDQTEMISLWAARNGVTVGEVHEDINWSGQTMNRPAFRQALERIDQGASAGLIVAMLDRFGRDTGAMLDVEQRIRKAGGVLVNLDGEFDTSTPEGEYMFGIFAMNATLKGRQIQRGWQRAHVNHVRAGIPTRPPFGYQRRGDDGSGRHPKSIVPVDDQAAEVVTIFAARARGDSFAAIAAELNARGVATSTGGEWTGGSVSALIRSRTYLGEVRFGDEVNAAAHEALVDEAVWHAAQTGGARAHPRRGESLLTGLVRCAGCRYTLESSAAMDRYRCAGRHAGGRCPEPVSIRRALLDEYVWGHMVARANEERLALQARRVTDRGQRDAIEAELAAARGAEDAFLDNLDAIVTLGQDRWNQQAARHRARIEAVEARLGQTVADDLADDTRVDWGAVERAPLEVRRRALQHGIDVVFLRGRPGRGAPVDLAGRVLIFERGAGPAAEQLPRRGPRTANAFACVPFPWPDDGEGPPAVVLG